MTVDLVTLVSGVREWGWCGDDGPHWLESSLVGHEAYLDWHSFRGRVAEDMAT